MSDKRWEKGGMTRIALILLALLSLVAALLLWLKLSSLGFPDGYLSPYHRAASPFWHLAAWGYLLMGLVFGWSAVTRKRGGRWSLGFLTLLFVLHTLLVAAGLPWYLQRVVGLSFGVGG